MTLGDVPESLPAKLTADGIVNHRVGEHLHVEIEGEANLPKVLGAALEAGARVVEVIPRRETLENLFMRRAIGGDENRGAA